MNPNATSKQLDAALLALRNAITNCPDNIWPTEPYWYRAFHTLFWTDLYMTLDPSTYAPPPTYNRDEEDPAGVMPPRVYTKDELLEYLQLCRTKSRAYTTTMTAEQADEDFVHGNTKIKRGELPLYVMRHIQHHTGQLNLLLRQDANIGSRWVFTGE